MNGEKIMGTIFKNSLIGMVLFVLSCIFSGLSLLIPSTFQNRAELAHVNFGFPLHFVVQDQSSLPIGYPDGPQFPARHGFLSPWEYPFQIIWSRFLLDILIIFVTLILALQITNVFWPDKKANHQA
jgi:hypothetical protein